MWHKGLIYKLKQNRISGNLLDSITPENKGSLQKNNSLDGLIFGLILGPLSFFVYINDLSDDLITNVQLFADDTFFFPVDHDENTSANNLNNDLRKTKD